MRSFQASSDQLVRRTRVERDGIRAPCERRPQAPSMDLRRGGGSSKL